MSGPWGDSPQLPRQVLNGVTRRARLLGRSVAGDDLFLLALCELPDDAPARRALAEEAIGARRLLPYVRVSGDRPAAASSLTFSPATYVMHGWAAGFAAATTSDGTIMPEHVLMALLWDPMSTSSQLLWKLGVEREDVAARLRHLDVPVPTAPLPRQREVTMGDREWFSRQHVVAVLAHLNRNIPPGTAWGFNYEGDEAWARAEVTVDLRALVEEAVT